MYRCVLTSDATEPSDELRSLLALVGDDLEGGAESLVVIGQPLQERLAFDQLQFYAALELYLQYQNIFT